MVDSAERARKGLLRFAGAASLGMALIVMAVGSQSSQATPAAGMAAAPKPVALNKVPKKLFNPNVKPGAKPKLPRRIGWSLPAGGELFTAFDRSVRQAAKSNRVQYLSAQANGDSPRAFQQTQDLLSRGVGALISVDLAPPALVPLQRKAIKQGIAVFCGPQTDCTQQLALDHCGIGRAQGRAAVKWIKANLGGKAEVAIFNSDQIPAQRPKGRCMRQVLKAGGSGIKIVSDINNPETADGGFKLTNTILQRHPKAKVWIGTDSVLAGTLSALNAAGKAKGTALFGVDGDPQALKEVAKGGPYKMTLAIPYPVLAYAWGKYAADWLAGKSIPLVLKARAFELTSKATIEAFKRRMAAPGKALDENQRTKYRYFTPFGNTSYEHHSYLTVVA